VGDGNINFVYIVEGPSGALVVKQGLPYIRIAHDWPLTQVGVHLYASHSAVRHPAPPQDLLRPLRDSF
jgi:5-methylthioribose kinase